ncbi:thioesterase II family protein [Hoyosella subflava]|uniref:Thioesterase TesA n=1 Tax=Hoyosella subflava (strain DSM 45089 / JCM 17490 / NBRC 109087 / DQS3-9A1) TaxID=443218 RepID=F6EID7_HOYSD|nr:alpha/beta fold hydrolase [Hoyosella subflava]AEF42429.1 Putative thioesterase [Hoyosella subflava DQS3-9A1]
MADSQWLRTFHQATAAKTELVCFPPAGGAASVYHALSAELMPSVRVLALQLPGRQDRLGDPMIDDITQLATAAATAIGSRNGTPVALFGHSMGATVAFETARALEGAGAELGHLLVSGRIAPHQTLDTAIHEGSDEALISELERLANDPASVQILREMPEIAEMVLPAVRNDYKAVETYRFEGDTPCLSCPVTVLVSSDDPTVTLDEVKEWERYTTGEFSVEVFPGGHFYLDEHTGAVAKVVSSRIC